jgi:Rad3-related DNA helicase
MKSIKIDDWRDFFPFSKIRKEQEQAIDFILQSFVHERKNYVVAQLAVGCGKSAVGITIARYLAANLQLRIESEQNTGAYILTTQKVLQEQYLNDFGPNKRKLLCSIKSSSNYTCLHYKDQNCGESRRILNKMSKQLAGTDFFKCCKTQCPYGIDKQAFINSPISVTNFSYFLAETMYAKKLEPRSLLIIDECHNIEAELGKFVEVTFSERFARDILKCKVPALNTQENVFEWIKKSYKPALSKHITKMEKLLESKFNSGMEGFGEYSKQYEMLDKHICKVNRFINSYNPENWVMNVIKPPQGSRGSRKFEFKSIDISEYSHDTLFRFGDKVLMMSATIVDKDMFCKSIGLTPEQVAFIDLPSPFPVENRQVHYLPVGSMSMKNIDKTLPILVETIKLLMNQHSDVKGIIHCVSFKIAQYIYQNIKSDRLLIHNSENRDKVLKEHITGDKPTVLLSPSMMEGVDLADDSSRFQILCKVPFPYLGDLVIKKRMAKNNVWYNFQTAKSVVQALGRSIRNENDYASSYILDADWEPFYNRSRSLFSSDFSKTLT